MTEWKSFWMVRPPRSPAIWIPGPICAHARAMERSQVERKASAAVISSLRPDPPAGADEGSDEPGEPPGAAGFLLVRMLRSAHADIQLRSQLRLACATRQSSPEAPPSEPRS